VLFTEYIATGDFQFTRPSVIVLWGGGRNWPVLIGVADGFQVPVSIGLLSATSARFKRFYAAHKSHLPVIHIAVVRAAHFSAAPVD